MISLECRFIKTLFNSLSRVDKINLLNNSNLNDRERCLLETRFVKGLSAKESADYFNLEFDTYNKTYHRTVFKLYAWLEHKAMISGVSITTLMEN